MGSNSTANEAENLIGLKALGILLLGVGGVGLGIAFSLDTAVHTGLGYVNNLGLMDDRRNYMMLASLSILVGAILFGFGTISRNRVAQSINSRACPFCAEQINVDAKICRYCQKDMPQPVQKVLMSVAEAIGQLRIEGYSLDETNSGWDVWEPSGDTKKISSDVDLIEYASTNARKAHLVGRQ